MAWFYLILAGLFEMGGVLMINKWHHDRKIISLLLLVLGFGFSFIFLAIAMETLPMGTAYAVWTGIGAAGGAILGMIFYNEPKDWKRIFFISLVIAATIGLKLIS
ncbi:MULTISPECIES: DMT family transporter [Sutcliffiella]|uniref:QacE family quaternary ammonium compound efflux SMR transporter n=1 Tax=Sutcliffiella cohnii TaxID=33932 RepID=A0A223KSL4_9BACI|nr:MULTISPECIES: multidrug efflux SMR transporter [Sutcliffiella]AST92348.1 QacE family quaternary ammonium compound efflux SMR transporter [Sutcliffiella cohnii]MED4017190.1 multidrug efflux SMR transporter [Sutcliffiella cohnii]WBL13579.1 multidrug efflux SMR transporter [Sutcliffiella sp. NC1]